MILQEPVKEEYRELIPKNPGRLLNIMFDRQSKVMEILKEREGFPMWPLDINERSNQVLIKDFIYRIIEELSEAYKERIILQDMMERNAPEQSEEKVVLYNEEIADALHFFIELFILVNIGAEDILSYFSQENAILQNESLEVKTLAELINAVKLYNDRQGLRVSNPEDFSVSYGYANYSDIKAGRAISITRTTKEAVLLWNITSMLTLAGNHLKNRPWKANTTITSGLNLQETLLEAFGQFISYLCYMNFNPQSLTLVFLLKNDINLKRFENE